MSIVRNKSLRTPLVVMWLQIRLPMQEAWVRSLFQEDPTCLRATKPRSCNYWAHARKARALQQEKPSQWEAHAPHLESSPSSPQLGKTQHTGSSLLHVGCLLRVCLNCDSGALVKGLEFWRQTDLGWKHSSGIYQLCDGGMYFNLSLLSHL